MQRLPKEVCNLMRRVAAGQPAHTDTKMRRLQCTERCYCCAARRLQRHEWGALMTHVQPRVRLTHAAHTRGSHTRLTHAAHTCTEGPPTSDPKGPPTSDPHALAYICAHPMALSNDTYPKRALRLCALHLVIPQGAPLLLPKLLERLLSFQQVVLEARVRKASSRPSSEPFRGRVGPLVAPAKTACSHMHTPVTRRGVCWPGASGLLLSRYVAATRVITGCEPPFAAP